MLAFRSPNLCKRLYSSFSIAADSEAVYLHNHIDAFLSNNILDSRTLLSTHAYIITTGHSQNKFLASKLIASYASLQQTHSSTKVFDSISLKDLFLWNSIIKAHFSNGNYVQAIEFFSKMRLMGNLPDQFTLPMVVSACAELGLFFIGMKVHGLVTKVNLMCGNPAIGASFVYMYSKCGAVEDASLVFSEISVRDVVAWTALVIGYVQNDESEKGLQCLFEMHRIGGYGERPNSRTLEGGFQACGDLCALPQGRCLHGFALKSGLVSPSIIQSAILSMYCKCGSVEDAQISFQVSDKDLFSCTAMIGIYARFGRVNECFQIFSRMQANGVHPDGMVISCLISGFASSMKVSQGKAFHGFILRRDCCVDQIVHSLLLSMYCKFGLLDLAEKIFVAVKNQVTESWNIMIVGYEKAQLENNCLMLFREMQHRGMKSDFNSLISVISSCLRLGAIRLGQSIHCHVIKNLMFEKVSVANSLINMYGKCGNLTTAQRLFHHTSGDISTWNSLISSYNDNGYYSKAVALFEKMISEGLKPNTATLVSSLSACAQIASLEKGKKIHNYITEKAGILEYDVSLSTALLDMYGKCGQLDTAREIFDLMNEKDVISWNVMISCYGMHGDGKSALEVFGKMEEYHVRPNGLTYLAILSACAHSGLVDEAKSLFDRMREHSLVQTLKHYACMVDVLGKSGCLDEAEALILSMPYAPDGGIWGSLLTACKMHNNSEMGMKIAKRAIKADPENDGYYILMSDFYSSVEMWEGVEQVRKMMKDRGVRKTVGWSTI